jgi:hypothetical protein
MTTNEWKTRWVEMIVDAGFSPRTAIDTFQAMYGSDGPDVNKNAEEEASGMLGKL